MRVFEDTIFNAEAVSNETSLTESVSLEHIYGYSVWATWAGTTISGSIKIQCSVDGSNWEDVASSEQTINAAGTYLWNIADAMYKYFRVSCTANDANTITVTCKYYGKGM